MVGDGMDMGWGLALGTRVKLLASTVMKREAIGGFGAEDRYNLIGLLKEYLHFLY